MGQKVAQALKNNHLREFETEWTKTRAQSEVKWNNRQKQNKNGPDRGHWSHILTSCTACPTPAHCHSGLVSLWQPQPLTQDLGCLKKKRKKQETDTNVKKFAQTFYHFYYTLCIPYCRQRFQWKITLVSSAALSARGQKVWHTPLCGDDSDIMPLLLLTVQLHHSVDKASVRGDAEQSLGVWLGIDGVPEIK